MANATLFWLAVAVICFPVDIALEDYLQKQEKRLVANRGALPREEDVVERVRQHRNYVFFMALDVCLHWTMVFCLVTGLVLNVKQYLP